MPDWTSRRTDIGGPDTMWAYPFNFSGDVPYHNITLDFVLEYPEMGENVTINQVMDISQAPLGAYTYV